MSNPTYGNSFRLRDPSRECLSKIVQRSRQRKIIPIRPLQHGETAMLQILNSFVTSMWSQKREFQGLLYPEGYMREESLRPTVSTPVSSAIKRVCLALCRDHKNCNTSQWVTVCFTDVSCFSLITTGRETGIHYLPSCVRNELLYQRRFDDLGKHSVVAVQPSMSLKVVLRLA